MNVYFYKREMQRKQNVKTEKVIEPYKTHKHIFKKQLI